MSPNISSTRLHRFSSQGLSHWARKLLRSISQPARGDHQQWFSWSKPVLSHRRLANLQITWFIGSSGLPNCRDSSSSERLHMFRRFAVGNGIHHVYDMIYSYCIQLYRYWYYDRSVRLICLSSAPWFSHCCPHYTSAVRDDTSSVQ